MVVLKKETKPLQGDNISLNYVYQEIVLDEVKKPTEVTKSIKIQLVVDTGLVPLELNLDVPKDLKPILLKLYESGNK